jgi:hypothetical protein
MLFIVQMAFLIGVWQPGPAGSMIYELTATPTPYAVEVLGLSAFSISYEDQDNDARFELADPYTWSHVTSLTTVYTQIKTVPDRNSTPYTDGDGLWVWVFATEDNFVWSQFWTDYWDYSKVAVPIPASALLLGAGLIPLALARRRKRLG